MNDQENQTENHRMDQIDKITQEVIDGGFDAVVVDLTRPD